MIFFLVGYYGFGNVGDQWLLHHATLWIKDHFPTAQIRVRKPGFLSCFRDFFASDAIVFGGGSLLQNKTSLRSLLFYAGILIGGRLLGKKRYLVGQGVGPLTGWFSRVLVRVATQGAAYFSVRDVFSYEEMQRLGVETELTEDLVFYHSLTPAVPYVLGSKIGVCLRGLSEQECAHVWEVLRHSGAGLVYIPMHVPEDLLHVDVSAVEEVLSIARVTEGVLSLRPVTLGLKGIVSARYHLCVYAGMMGIPFVALDVDPKLRAVAHHFGQRCVKPNEFSLGCHWG